MSNPSHQLDKSTKTKRALFILSVCGIIIGSFLTFSPGTVFVLILAAICGFLILKPLPPGERKFVKWVLIAGLALRILVAVGMDAAAFVFFDGAVMQKVEAKNPPDSAYEWLINEKTRCFFKNNDSDYYSVRGYVYTAYAKGIDNIVIRDYLNPGREGYGWNGYFYIIGLFYYLFDYSPIAVKFLNCLISMLAAIFIYKIALNFSKKTARAACLMTVFFPTMIFWSTANTKGPMLTLLSAVAIWSFITLIKSKKIRYLAIPILCIITQLYFTQKEIWLILAVSLILVFIAMLSLRKKILLISLLLIIYMIMPKNIQYFSMRKIVKAVYSQHIGHVNTGGLTYRVLDDEYYSNADLLDKMGIREFIVSATKSVRHFLFEPFPNRIVNLYVLITYIQMLLWYLLLFFAAVGFIRGKIYGYEAYLPVFFYILFGTLALALGSGNVGTLVRHRDIITPFYFVFAAIGITHLFRLDEAK